MADATKTLGQSIPAGNTLTTLYTVPASTMTAVSSVAICNQGSSAATFRISIALAGAADTAKQYIYYDETIQAKDTFVATIGIALATTDLIRVLSSSGQVSFSAFGVEVGTSPTTGQLFLTAAGMWPRTTNPCATATLVELATNRENLYLLDFDQATQEYCQGASLMPSDWDAGTVTATFYWTTSAASGNVVWGLQARAFTDDDAIDQAYGTAQEVTDGRLAGNDMHISSATSAITLGGTPAGNRWVSWQVYRKAADAADTLNGDARLIGVRIDYTRTAT